MRGPCQAHLLVPPHSLTRCRCPPDLELLAAVQLIDAEASPLLVALLQQYLLEAGQVDLQVSRHVLTRP